MKSSQEKAEELVDKYYLLLQESKGYYDLPNAKQCALIAVNEILNKYNDFIQTHEQFLYWNEVKQEIEKL
jgi:hypothetical protein